MSDSNTNQHVQHVESVVKDINVPTKCDYISRQAAIDAFGLSEKTRKYGGDHSGYDTRMLYEIQGVLECLPSADVVEVVRCKDCQKQHSDECPMYSEEWYEWDDDGYVEKDYVIHDYSSDDGFCDKAERRNDAV